MACAFASKNSKFKKSISDHNQQDAYHALHLASAEDLDKISHIRPTTFHIGNPLKNIIITHHMFPNKYSFPFVNYAPVPCNITCISEILVILAELKRQVALYKPAR